MLIKVVDQGIGLTPEHLNNLFTPFSVAKDEASRKKNPSGNGLGLSICKKIMMAMKGDITVESYRDFGSTFIAQFIAQETQVSTLD